MESTPCGLAAVGFDRQVVQAFLGGAVPVCPGGNELHVVWDTTPEPVESYHVELSFAAVESNAGSSVEIVGSINSATFSTAVADVPPDLMASPLHVYLGCHYDHTDGVDFVHHLVQSASGRVFATDTGDDRPPRVDQANKKPPPN